MKASLWLMDCSSSSTSSLVARTHAWTRPHSSVMMDDSEAPLSHRTAIFSQLGSICCPDQLRHGTTFSAMAAATCATPGHSGIMRATSFALGLSRTCTVHCTPKLAHEHDITAPNNHHFYCAAMLRWCAGGSRALQVVLTNNCTGSGIWPTTNIIAHPR